MNDSAKKHILIVEDSLDLQHLLGRLFQRAGYTLSQAYDGRQALDMLNTMNERPSLILLDIMMPIMDGIEFRHIQKNDPELSKIPVIVMTADSDPEHRAQQMSAAHYFEKPIRSIDQLLHVADETCRR